MPLDTYITNLFEHSYEHWWCHRHHVKWRVTTLVIRSLFFLMTGCTQGYNQNPHPSPTPTPTPTPTPSPTPTPTPTPDPTEALEILCDEMSRKLYNEGYDKAAIEERVQAASRAARDHNKDGCCGGGCH